jgi:hypothetical protein
LAEIGCSALQIAAITGHATLKEVSRYTNRQRDAPNVAVDMSASQPADQDQRRNVVSATEPAVLCSTL